MNNPFGLWVTALAGTFAWTLLWQSTLWLALGLGVSRIWSRRAARAHLLLVLATVAAVASPLLTAGVRGLGWGVLPPGPSPEAFDVRPEDTLPISETLPAIKSTERPELPIAEEAAPDLETPANAHVAENSSPPTVAESVLETTVPAQMARPSTLPLGNSLPGVMVGAWIVCSLALFHSNDLVASCWSTVVTVFGVCDGLKVGCLARRSACIVGCT